MGGLLQYGEVKRRSMGVAEMCRSSVGRKRQGALW